MYRKGRVMTEHDYRANDLNDSADPVTVPSVLKQPTLTEFDIDFSSLLEGSEEAIGRVNKHPKTAAIILAGGQGERFGRSGGKQLIEVAGKPVLTWSAEAFDAVGDVGLIVIVCPEERTEEYLHAAIDPYPFVTPIVMAPSGSIRQESAFSGLELVPENYEYVVLHDGARPVIDSDLISHVISVLKGNLDADGAVVAYRSIDTLKIVENGVIVGTPDRSVFWNAQTPQVFRAGIYRRAHAAALADGFVGTDDSSLIERLGGRVLVVEGSRNNIKLTVPEDFLMLAPAIRDALRQRYREGDGPFGTANGSGAQGA